MRAQVLRIALLLIQYVSLLLPASATRAHRDFIEWQMVSTQIHAFHVPPAAVAFMKPDPVPRAQTGSSC